MENLIKRVKLDRLRNNEWFQIMADFWREVRERGAETLKITALWEVFIPLYQKADRVMKPIEKSSLTEELVKLDAKRDEIFASTKDYVKSFTKHYDAAKCTAGKRLWVIFTTYGNLAKEDYPAETSDVYNLVQELRLPKYAADVTLLALTPYVTELDKVNKEFRELYATRISEQNIDKPDYNGYEVRKELDAVYHKIIRRLEALVEIEGIDDYKEFIEVWNGYVQKYINLLAQREGRKEDEEDSVIARQNAEAIQKTGIINK